MAASRTNQIYEALKQELLDGLHVPRSKLQIDLIAARFEVSLGAVREALSRLTSDRLVVAEPQRGFTVAPVSTEDLVDLTAVRIEIETRCLRSSILRGNLEWEGRLLDAWHQLSRTPPKIRGVSTINPDWTRLHTRFHDDLIAACDSKWWLRLRDQLYLQAERYRRMMLPTRGLSATSTLSTKPSSTLRWSETQTAPALRSPGICKKPRIFCSRRRRRHSTMRRVGRSRRNEQA